MTVCDIYILAVVNEKEMPLDLVDQKSLQVTEICKKDWIILF